MDSVSEKFIQRLLEEFSGASVVYIYEFKLTKPERGYNLVIEFNNGRVLKINGYVSFD